MVGVGAALTVGFPDVELEATCSVVADAGIDVVVAAGPVLAVCLSVDPLDVVRTLSVTVARAVCRACRVARVVETSVLLHLNEVQGTIQTTGELGHVHVECELLVLQSEHVISLARLVQQVCPGADVLAVLPLSHKLERHGAGVIRRDAVRVSVVGITHSLLM